MAPFQYQLNASFSSFATPSPTANNAPIADTKALPVAPSCHSTADTSAVYWRHDDHLSACLLEILRHSCARFSRANRRRLADEAGPADDALGRPSGHQRALAGISAPAAHATGLDESQRHLAISTGSLKRSGPNQQDSLF